MPDEPELTPRQREIVKLLADLLVADYRAHPTVPPTAPPPKTNPVWLTAPEAAEYLRVGLNTFFAECRAKRIRHARVGGRKAIRVKREWLDEFLEASAPKEIPPKPQAPR